MNPAGDIIGAAAPAPRNRLAGLLRGLAWLVGGLAAALLLGFGLFVAALPWHERTPEQPQDGIVALTGGAERVEEALGLLARGYGSRLLITGVNRRSTREGVRRSNAGERSLVECCVDLDYDARDTVGNAEAISRWARAHGFRSLLVVTSNYHLPRALAELELALPEVRKVPYPVVAGPRPHDGWGQALARTRLFATEYLKFLVVWTKGRLPAGLAAGPAERLAAAQSRAR